MIFIYEIIEIITSFVEIFICYKFLNLIFKDRTNIKVKKFKSLMYTVVLTICVYLNNQIALFSNILLIFVIISIGISAILLYKTNFLQSITVVGTYYLFLTIFDLFSIFCVNIFTKNENIGKILISEVGIYRCIFIVAMKIILILFYVYIRNKDIDYEIVLHYWGFWLTLCIIGYSALFYFQQFAIYKLTEVLASNWLLFLVVLFMLILLFYMYTKYRDYKEKSMMINVRNEMIEKNYMYIQKLYKDNRYVIHDFKNHIAVISNYVQNFQNEKALDYMNNIAQPIYKIDNTVKSGIESVDIILNCKIGEADTYNIKLDTYVNIDESKVTDTDFCTILSNLLDNAIESSIKDIQEKRYIKITMKSINNMLIIKVKNNVVESPIFIGTGLRTTKDGRGHGIGLESVQSCVDKYDGNIKFKIDEGFFETQIVLLSV